MSTNHHDAHSTLQALTSALQNLPMAQLDQAIINQAFADEGIVTLASDVLAAPAVSGKDTDNANRNIVVAAQSGTADDLIEVTGLTIGNMILLRADAGDTITVKHNAGGATNKIHCLGDRDKVLNEQNGILLVQIATNILVQLTGASSGSRAVITDEKATTTDGGGSSATSWNARDLNNEQYDKDGLVTISSNKFTPIANDYKLHAVAPAVGVAQLHRLRLYNVTQASVFQEGPGVKHNSANDGGLATLDCDFSADGIDEYRIDHYTSVATATNGLGWAIDDGSPEIYLVVILEVK